MKMENIILEYTWLQTTTYFFLKQLHLNILQTAILSFSPCQIRGQKKNSKTAEEKDDDSSPSQRTFWICNLRIQEFYDIE